MTSVKIRFDPDAEMMQITNHEGKTFMDANYWDFPQDAEGYERMFTFLGLSVEMEEYDYFEGQEED
jgi:hypothetical protein